ncbi:MAG TPA: LamG-like jellyroll fold domain-containing protein [Polyangiaceae bacterium]|jgi:hypothetical protein
MSRISLCRFEVGTLLALFAASVACSSGSSDGANVMNASGAGGSASGAAGSGTANAGSGAGGANAGTSGAAGSNASGGSNAQAGSAAIAGTGGAGTAGTSAGGAAGTGGGQTYDQLVLADGPVAYWDVNRAPVTELDLTGNGHDGTYQGAGAPPRVELPNGDSAADFDGKAQYLSVPSSAAFSIPTTGNLSWEAWIRPDVLQFPNDSSSGYVDWMGKCEDYGPTCEWEARMYDLTTQENPNRPNRISAYVFNPTAGLGSAADFQPAANMIAASAWYHVVGEYTTQTQPADCMNTAMYPGSIDIWVNGVKWNHASHGQTGCMSQYVVVPKANTSPLDIGTMAKDTFFQGAIAKVAIYNKLLSVAQINAHYAKMTGKMPAGSCADTCSL